MMKLLFKIPSTVKSGAEKLPKAICSQIKEKQAPVVGTQFVSI